MATVAEREEAAFGRIRRSLTAWYVAVLSAALLAAGSIVYLETSRALLAAQDETLQTAALFAARTLVPAMRHEALERSAARADRRAVSRNGDNRENGADNGDNGHDDNGDSNGDNGNDGHDGGRNGDQNGDRRNGRTDLDLDELAGEPLAATLAWTYVRIREGDETRLGAPQRVTAFPDLSSARLASRTGEESYATLRAGGEFIRIYNHPVVEGNLVTAVVQTGLPITPAMTALGRIRLALVLLGILALLAAGAGGLFLAGRALVPVRRAFEQLRRFTADASHELRTPLAIVRTSAELLERRLGGAPPETRELVDNVLSEARRMERLVSDLLTLARADAGETMEREPVDLAAVAAEAARKAGVLASRKGITLATELPDRLTIRGDRGRLLQLVLILLDNAVKYTDPGGRVTLRLGTRGRLAELAVSDTGVGIPRQDLARIFDRFYRVDKARSRAAGGTGLGLAIAAWIARSHGGRIRVESEPGRGSTFTVELPAGEPDAATGT